MTAATIYSPEFYAGQVDASRRAAEIILGLLFPMLGTPRSVCDVGCGTGCWLDVAKRLGAELIHGFDGEYARESLVIPGERFCACNLNLPLVSPESVKYDEKYDLCISLETAEHLEPESAETFIQSLTDLSDVVLFSAAIPGQGGTGHINEQWTSYWVKLFAKRGFACYDVIRPLIWEDQRIPFWYRQNTLVFENVELHVPGSLWDHSRATPRTIVHPELYMQRSSFFH